MWNGYVKR